MSANRLLHQNLSGPRFGLKEGKAHDFLFLESIMPPNLPEKEHEKAVAALNQSVFAGNKKRVSMAVNKSGEAGFWTDCDSFSPVFFGLFLGKLEGE